MDRSQKKALVEEMNGVFQSNNVIIMAHYKGLTVAQMTELRAQMRKAGAGLKVTQNRLTKLALVGTQFESLNSKFVGPTAIAFSADPVAAAKVMVDFAKTNEKLVVIGGAFGERQLAIKDVEVLAKLPSLDELRAKIVGMLQTPATRIAAVLQAPGGQVARVLGAHAAKG